MVQVSQEQKRVIKKFVHVGFDIGTLEEYDVWNIHYSLTCDNVAIPAKERPKSAKTLSREVWAYREGLSSATFLCLSGMWRVRCIARETVNVLDSGIMKRLDTETDAEFTKVVDGLLANDDYIIREQWPNALVENTDIWYLLGDGMNEEWQSLIDRLYLEQADKRHAEDGKTLCGKHASTLRQVLAYSPQSTPAASARRIGGKRFAPQGFAENGTARTCQCGKGSGTREVIGTDKTTSPGFEDTIIGTLETPRKSRLMENKTSRLPSGFKKSVRRGRRHAPSPSYAY